MSVPVPCSGMFVTAILIKSGMKTHIKTHTPPKPIQQPSPLVFSIVQLDSIRRTHICPESDSIPSPCPFLLSISVLRYASVPLSAYSTFLREHQLTALQTKPLEHRTALTPSTTKALLEAGYPVNVERSSQNIFDDADYEKIGATLVPEGSWPDVPADHIIIGLKELPEESFPLKHTHVQFAHCYKGQGGWQDVLSRFPRGGGVLYDLEFLQDETGRRVAAFGFHAGFAGAALAVKTWAHQLATGKSDGLPGVKPYAREELLVDDVKKSLQEGEKKAGKTPRCFVMGALGRCGRGAVDLLQKAGIPDENIVKWDIQETSKKQGPYPEILESDVSNHSSQYLGRMMFSGRPLPCYAQQANTTVSDLRQLHLPLGSHPTIHRALASELRIPCPERRLRRLVRHHKPTQPHPDLQHQHDL